MAKFVSVKEVPAELNKGEYAIGKPSFLPEIQQQKSKAPKSGLVGRFHLRLIVDTIGQKYDPENMTGWVIKTHLYEGRPFANDQELNDIVLEALQTSYPQVFDKYLEYQVKHRPAGTDLVYLVESPYYTTPEETLYKFGMSEKEEITGPRKTVGRPAVTKEQAEQLKQK